MKKSYLALVLGTPPETSGRIDVLIYEDLHRPGRVRIVEKRGKPSCSFWRRAEPFRGYSLLAVRPKTGRTHQIRVSLRHLGYPLAVDTLYGGRDRFLLSELKRNYKQKKDRPETPLLSRLSLHAARVRLRHPITGEWVVVSADLPKDFRLALKYLRQLRELVLPGGPPVGLTAKRRETYDRQEGSMSGNLAIFGVCLVILGAFFLMLAITVKSPRTIMREILGVQVDRLKTFRYFITQRLEATLGFLFIMFGLILLLLAVLQDQDTPNVGIYIIITIVAMAVVGVLTYRFCNILAKWIFIGLFRTYAERYRVPIHRDESLLKELGDILEIPRDEEETIETFAEKIRKRLDLSYQPRTRP